MLDDAEVCEGGLPEETAAYLGLAGFGREVEGGRGTEVELVEVVAVGEMARLADFALLAEGERAEDGIARLGDGYAGADFFDVARAFCTNDIPCQPYCLLPYFQYCVELPSCPKILG